MAVGQCWLGWGVGWDGPGLGNAVADPGGARGPGPHPSPHF